MVAGDGVFKKTKLSERKSFGNGSKYSRKEVMTLHEVFASLDKTGDGRISLKELVERLPDVDHSSGRVPPIAVLRALDVNKDGILTFKEMLLRLYPLATAKDLEVMHEWAYPKEGGTVAAMERFQPSEEQLQELQAMFKLYDIDGSGYLEYEELVQMANRTGYDPDEIEDLFIASDTNQDRKIEFGEFVEMLKGAFL